jgi:hypothetical protein
MKGIEFLPFLSKEQRKLLETSEINYRRFARIYFRILSYDGKELIIKVWQTENPSGKYLSSKELIERTKNVFTGIIPENVELRIRPIPFNKIELENFSPADASRKMEKLGLQPKDLVKLLNIDKSSISLMLNGERELSKPGRAMFYYLFKYLELDSSKIQAKLI